jgi:hypothetical protein
MKPYNLTTAEDNLALAIDEYIDLFNNGEPFTMDNKIALGLLSAKLELFSACIYNVATQEPA